MSVGQTRCVSVLLLVGTVAVASPALGGFRGALALRLVENADPALARRGTAIALIYSGEETPPYGYPYAVRVRVRKRCRGTAVALSGGLAVGWVSEYLEGPFVEHPEADQAAAIPYGDDLGDGSTGRAYPCFGAPSEPRDGTIYLYHRAPEHWGGDEGHRFHVMDVLWCSSQLGCTWYFGYSRLDSAPPAWP